MLQSVLVSLSLHMQRKKRGTDYGREDGESWGLIPKTVIRLGTSTVEGEAYVGMCDSTVKKVS